jgi:hypothetical protein
MTGMRPYRSVSQAWMKSHPLHLMLLHSLQIAFAIISFPSSSSYDNEKQSAQNFDS